MKKITVSKRIVQGLNPCVEGYQQGIALYPNFEGDVLDFLALKKIPVKDRLWVALRLLPTDMLVVFAIDCAFSASVFASKASWAASRAASRAAARAASDAASKASWAASRDAAEDASWAASRDAERERDK